MVFSSSPAVMERISFPPYPAVAMIVSASQASNKRQFGNKYFLKMTIMKKYVSSQSKQPVLLLPFLVPWDPLQAADIAAAFSANLRALFSQPKQLSLRDNSEKIHGKSPMP